MQTRTESARIEALRSYDILDTPPEPDFDDLVKLVAQVCEAPRAGISLIDADRQWFKAEIGLNTREIPLNVSLCAEIVLQPGLTVIRDVTKDRRFASNPLVTGHPTSGSMPGCSSKRRRASPLGRCACWMTTFAS